MRKWLGAALAFVLILSALPLDAQERRFNDWVVDRSNDGTFFYAATGSLGESGSEDKLFAQSCYIGGSCIWLLAIKLGCEQDAEYPVLLNGESGAQILSLKCMGPIEGTRMFRYGFTDFDKISVSVERNKLIGFAFPLKSGYFQVLRFSLIGASNAIVDAQQRASRAVPPISPTRRGLRDEKL